MAGLLRAGHTDYVINQAALDYMRDRALSGAVIRQLAAHGQTWFADQAAWQTHLDQLGIGALRVTPDPVCIATEGALWGSVQAHPSARAAYQGINHPSYATESDSIKSQFFPSLRYGVSLHPPAFAWRHPRLDFFRGRSCPRET